MRTLLEKLAVREEREGGGEEVIGSYLEAFDKRIQWAIFAEKALHSGIWADVIKDVQGASHTYAMDALATFGKPLLFADMFYMDRYFCDLTDNAADNVPPDMQFDMTWLLSKYGWMYLAEPFSINRTLPEAQFVRAIAWQFRPDMERISTPGGLKEKIDFGTTNVVEVALYGEIENAGKSGFYPIRSVVLADKWSPSRHRVLDKELYPESKYSDTSRCWSWLITAFHLMAQRVAVTVRQKADRAAIKRAKRENLEEVSPIVNIITLRRTQEDREREGIDNAHVDWQWRWAVRGHWRNQFFPSDSSHRPVFVDSYVKGPEGKPFKPVGVKLFKATR